MNIHPKQYTDSEGDFDRWVKSERPCRYCGLSCGHFWRTWDSSDGAFTDWNHECHNCGKAWWIEGIDS